VTKDKCLASWGGTDNYEFSFVPESKPAISKPMAANAGDAEQPHQDTANDKKVSESTGIPILYTHTGTRVIVLTN